LTDAFATAWYDRLWAFVRGRVGGDADADDITHDVLLRMHTRRGQLEDGAKLKGWMYAIARNAIVDHHRARRRDPEELAHEPVADADEESDIAIFVAEWLAESLPALPDESRQALELTDLGDMSQAAAAEHLGISKSGMRSRVQRGRKRLKRVLDSCCQVELDRRRHVVSCEPKEPGCC